MVPKRSQDGPKGILFGYLEGFEAILSPFCVLLGSFLDKLGAILGPLGSHLGASLGHLGANLQSCGQLGLILEALWNVMQIAHQNDVF